MAAKHTPAPWAINSISSHDMSIGIAAGRCVIASVHNGVSVMDVIFERVPAEQMANADLIAASPDLLAALKPFADAYATWNGGKAVEHFASAVVPADFARAATAFAKATGAN